MSEFIKDGKLTQFGKDVLEGLETSGCDPNKCRRCMHSDEEGNPGAYCPAYIVGMRNNKELKKLFNTPSKSE